jgi:hypothetical protein
VRWFGHGLAGSVAAHVAIVGALAWWLDRDPDHPDVVEAAAPTDVEIDVVTPTLIPPPRAVPVTLVTVPMVPAPATVIEAPAVATTAAPAPRTAPRRPGEMPRSPSQAMTATTAPAPPETGPSRPGMLAMRDLPRRPDLRRGDLGRTLARIAAGGAPPPPPIPESGRLAPDGGGTSRIDDLTFTADVDRDGSVHIHDKRNLHAHLKLPSRKGIGDALSRWASDPYAYNERLAAPNPADLAPRGDHARLKPDDQKPDHGQTVPIIGGGFDLTDWIARKALGARGDPYARRKLAALDATRAERVEMGRRYHTEILAAAEQIARRNLSAVWGSAMDPEAKRRAMFLMWDDCAESGSRELVAAGRHARKAIIGFIRAHLPAGSAGAYTAAELRSFNAQRTSKAVFAPYDEDLGGGGSR